MIACRLLGIDYMWNMMIGGGERQIVPAPDQWETVEETNAFWPFLDDRVMTSQTHGAFINLIDGNADIIVVSSLSSPD
jgi:hypothetical protein